LLSPSSYSPRRLFPVLRCAAAGLLACLLLSSCGVASDRLFTVWGPLTDPENPDSPDYSWGGSFEVTGLAHRVEINDGSGGTRDFLEVVLVGGAAPVSCSLYTDYLAEIRELQDYIDAVGSTTSANTPTVAEWREYVCQQIQGAALRAFGGDGSYRAVHLLALVDSVGTGPADAVFGPRKTGSADLADGNERFFGAEVFAADTPGAEDQAPEWTYVSRIYERSKHGEDIVPTAGLGPWVDDDPDPLDSCLSLLDTFERERDTPVNEYPDIASMALQAATNRYYHQYTSQVEMDLGENLEPIPHGLFLPRWSDAATSGDNLGLAMIGRASRTPPGMPYERVVVTTRSTSIPLTPCSGLSGQLPVVWPELVEGR